MIFVTVGTTEQPFDRLLRAVGTLGIEEEIVLQFGHSTFLPPNARPVKFLGFDEMKGMIDRARVVLCHAGAGSVLNALCFGKRPVVAPRLRKFGEMVDDHQLDLVEAFRDSVIPYLPGDDLAGKIAAAGAQEHTIKRQPSRQLVTAIQSFIEPASASTVRRAGTVDSH